MKRAVRIFSIVLLAIAALVLALLVRGKLHENAIVKRFPPPGRMVDVGGRRLHLLCKGSPSSAPTVIIEGGAFGASTGYWAAQNAIATSARVCVYDRAGLGWSDPAPLPRTLKERTDDLHTLLTQAEVRPPYILLAHSLGGLLARIYIQEYPQDVVGLVLAESSEEQLNGRQDIEKDAQKTADQIGMGIVMLRTGFEIPQIKIPGGPPEQDIIQRASVFRAAQDDFVTMAHLSEQLRAVGSLQSLGNLPLVVIRRGKRDANRSDSLAKDWADAQARLAALSTRSELIVAEKSGHNVMLDQPELLAAAVTKVLQMTAADSQSPPSH